jgi:hypothetical protein
MYIAIIIIIFDNGKYCEHSKGYEKKVCPRSSVFSNVYLNSEGHKFNQYQ